METNKNYPDLIYTVIGNLDRFGFRMKVEKLECKDTTKSFVTPTKRISKEKMNKPQTNLRESHMWLNYFIYCEEAEIENAKELIKDTITAKITKVKSELEAVTQHLPL